jgi:hypothetical protein
MTEYQTVVVRLRGRSLEDEESLTDLLNERARMGWTLQAVTPIPNSRLLVIFVRQA